MSKKLSKVVARYDGDNVELRFYSFAGRGRHALHARVHTTLAEMPALLGGDQGNPALLLKPKRVVRT